MWNHTLYMVGTALSAVADTTAEVTAEETQLAFGERVSLFGEVSLLGMVTVFLVLSVLWGLVALIGHFFDRYQKKKNAASLQAASDAAPTADAETAAARTASSDGALVAAITAAIACYIAQDDALREEYDGGFRVVSFRRD